MTKNSENGYGYGICNWGADRPLYNGFPRNVYSGHGQGRGVICSGHDDVQYGTGNYNLNQYGKNHTMAVPGRAQTKANWWRRFGKILYPWEGVRRLWSFDKCPSSGRGDPDCNARW